MLTLSAKAPSKPLSRNKAWTCIAINQLAFPGLGTVMAGRRSGYLEGAIKLAGFFLTMCFMCGYFSSLFSFMVHSQGSNVDFIELCRPYAWAGISGLGLCFIAWCWSLISSIGILREVSGNPPDPANTRDKPGIPPTL